MTTLADIEQQLPWGFHDAHLEKLAIDWMSKTVTMVMRLPMTKHQNVERRAQITVSGLYFCSVEPPPPPGNDYEPTPDGGLWIDGGEGPGDGATRIPSLPPGTFLHHIYVQSWNFRAIHIAGTNARLDWLNDEQPRMTPGGALFPGDSIPDP